MSKPHTMYSIQNLSEHEYVYVRLRSTYHTLFTIMIHYNVKFFSLHIHYPIQTFEPVFTWPCEPACTAATGKLRENITKLQRERRICFSDAEGTGHQPATRREGYRARRASQTCMPVYRLSIGKLWLHCNQ